jgi:hypothetical protein
MKEEQLTGYDHPTDFMLTNGYYLGRRRNNREETH